MSDEFVVNDKRLFTKDGELNAGAPETPKVEAEAPGSGPRGGAASPSGRNAAPAPPPADFTGLLVGLATSAFIHLGEDPEPGQPETQPDLVAAKHAIDLLAVLQAKTRGNLEPEEEALLTTLLYDLRMRYVRARK